ncbi:MAG: response regulator [Myxococcales bacterium]
MPTRRILVLDDDPDFGDALEELLSFEGFLVERAFNGQQALDRLHREPPPAAILLDLMMPVMDGYEFRARQRGDSALARIPVVVLTAGRLTERVRSLDAECLGKPVVVERMLAALERATSGIGPPSPCASASVTPP